MDRSEATAEANDQQPPNVDPQDPPSSSSKIQPDAASALFAQPTAPDSLRMGRNAGASQDDPYDWFPDSDYELKHVKVYELIGSRWVDRGTAFCFRRFNDETNEALLIARSESNYAEVILSTAIRSNDVYRRQRGAKIVVAFHNVTNYFPNTLIVWTEPDGVDYALSLRDPEGCSEVRNFIPKVQRLLNRSELSFREGTWESEPGIIGSSSPTPGNGDSVAAANVIRSRHLPQVVTIRPGHSKDVTIKFAPPNNANPKQLPVYSGFIRIASPDEALKVTYLGTVGSLRAEPIIDQTEQYFGPGVQLPI
ncbi:hypothetical protein BDN71DRAFT_1512742, partial [Pleurotus eryngii]